jgi:hypothetical protein
MLPTPWLIAVALVVGLLVLIPARRLQLAGMSARTIGLYALLVWALAMVLVIRPAGARILVPFLLVAYLAPFVAAPDSVRRVLGRGRIGGPGGGAADGRPPIKNVTPDGSPEGEARDEPPATGDGPSDGSA